MKHIETLAALHTYRQSIRESVAFVPTMGALHEGHLALIEQAKRLAPVVMVSVFVNPMQFGAGEDYERYPRTLAADLALCQSAGVKAVFTPAAAMLYPDGTTNTTRIVPPDTLGNAFEGAVRPGHFTGVATVVMKLFQLITPDYAVFGQKDAQQLAVIQQMVADLNSSVQIVSVETVREYDGLAKSSRNRYLQSDSDRRQARLLSRLLGSVQAHYRTGIDDAQTAINLAEKEVLDQDLYPDFALDYLAAVHGVSFERVPLLKPETLIIVAAKVGTVRLIDNATMSTLLIPETPTALINVA